MTVLLWRLAGLAVVAALIAGWSEIAALKWVSPVFLPSPERAWTALVHGLAHADLGEKLSGTIEHMLAGWLIASTLGIALGALIGSSALARTYVGPTLEFLQIGRAHV